MGSGTKLAVALAWVSVMSSLGRRGKRVLGVSSLLIAVARLLLHWNRSGHVSRVRRKQSPTVAIAGTGMAGLCLAVSLKRRGIDSFVMYEKTGDVGGTWNVNTYPGCACDVPVHLYQPSFDLESGWPDRYASQRDLHRNLKRLFLQYDLMRHVVFHTEVKEADFAADKHRWTLQLRSHSEHKTYSAIASVFVSCIGQLSIPKYPAFVDIHHESSSSSSSSSSFTPPYPNHVHSGAWRSDLVLKGKTVAIVGSAASAVQLLGPVAEQAKHVYVFQRSPNWMMPQWKYTYPSFVRALFRVVPGLMRLYRWWQWVLHEAGYLGFLKGNIGHRVVSWALMRYMKTQAKQYTQAKQARKENDKVADKPVLDLLEADAIDLLPTYAMGCKRILMENGWYDNLNRENVVLIKKGVHAVKQHCVCVRVHETKSVQLDVDAVIYCTGYHSTCFLQPMHVLGIDKTETLSQAWERTQHHSHLGMSVPSFPNFFVMYGPYTNLGHHSITFQLECQAEYISGILEAMTVADIARVDVKTATMAEYFSRVDARMAKTVWTADCGSWYAKDGVVINNSPWTTTEYWLQTRNSTQTYVDDYDLVFRQKSTA